MLSALSRPCSPSVEEAEVSRGATATPNSQNRHNQQCNLLDSPAWKLNATRETSEGGWAAGHTARETFPSRKPGPRSLPVLSLLTGFCSSPPHYPQGPHPNDPSRGRALTSVPGFLRLAFLMALLFSTSSLATEKVPTCSDKEWGYEAGRTRWWDRTVGPNRQACTR